MAPGCCLPESIRSASRNPKKVEWLVVSGASSHRVHEGGISALGLYLLYLLDGKIGAGDVEVQRVE
jgi:hypothetical protein